MKAKTFVETSVLIHAHCGAAVIKHDLARQVLRDRWDRRISPLGPRLLYTRVPGPSNAEKRRSAPEALRQLY